MCDFCEEIAIKRDVWDSNTNDKVNALLSVAIVENTIYNGKWRGVSLTYADKPTPKSTGFTLNYCPQCGRKIDRAEVSL